MDHIEAVKIYKSNETLSKALKNKKFRALLTCDKKILSKLYPSIKGEFNKPLADLELCVMLAQYFTPDYQIIDHLFRASELCGPEWLYNDAYRGAVINGAIDNGN